MFGGQVGVGGHLTIGRGAVAVGQSGVTNSLDAGAMVAGYPAIDSREWRKASVVFRRLPELKRRIEELEAQARRADRGSVRRAGRSSPRVSRVVLVVWRWRCCGVRRARADRPDRRHRRRTASSSCPRFAFHCQHRAPVERTTSASSGTRTSAASSTSSTTRAGALTFVANYQAILGEEFRAFDPNQGNYILEGPRPARRRAGRAGRRVPSPVAASQRPRRSAFPVDWNMIGVARSARFTAGASHVDARAPICAASIQKSFVDYRWELDGGVRGDRGRLRPRVGARPRAARSGISASTARATGAARPASAAKAGVRLEGRAGAARTVCRGRAPHRPVSAGVLDRDLAVTAGFRLLTR